MGSSDVVRPRQHSKVLQPRPGIIDVARIAHATQGIPGDVLAATSPVVAAATAKKKDS
jgi:hypothetical protein